MVFGDDKWQICAILPSVCFDSLIDGHYITWQLLKKKKASVVINGRMCETNPLDFKNIVPVCQMPCTSDG